MPCYQEFQSCFLRKLRKLTYWNDDRYGNCHTGFFEWAGIRYFLVPARLFEMENLLTDTYCPPFMPWPLWLSSRTASQAGVVNIGETQATFATM